MTKDISVGMAIHLQGEVTTLATMWHLTRQDGTEYFFTDHDEDITYDGDTYKSATGYNRTAIANDSSLAVDNMDLVGILDSADIDEEELRAGLYNYAELEIFIVNWADLTDGIIKMRKGHLGEVTITQTGIFRAEVRGLTQELSQRIGRLYTGMCDADLGDSRCGITLSSYTDSGSVTSATDRKHIVVSGLTEAAGYYDGGLLTWTSGQNDGRSMEVKSWDGTDAISFFLSAPYEPSAGDTFDIHPGCDKKLKTCKDTFSNAINFRGTPFIPGQDEYMRYPDAK